ncbi:MAG: sugar ABC transporter ATP-binding protein [bacterium]|nr:sugar ABC transporter ATP-binding protein [bacterium]
MKDSTLVEMLNISKHYGKVAALDNVSITIKHNEILGLLGDNGAGKSTLVKIISGLLIPDQGDIYLEGKPVTFSSPKDARTLGIDTVEQNLSLINIMNISRNFFLGREPFKKIGPIRVLDRKKMNRDCKKAVEGIGVHVRTPKDLVSTLSGGERQAISIGRAFYFGCRLLLLDEPLAALSVKEARKVHAMIIKAKEAGHSIVYITHNVHHVYPIADRFVILDRGKKLAEMAKNDAKPEDIIETIASGTMVTT